MTAASGRTGIGFEKVNAGIDINAGANKPASAATCVNEAEDSS